MLPIVLTLLLFPVEGSTAPDATPSVKPDLAALTSHVIKLEQTVSNLQTQSQTQEQKYAVVLSNVLSKLTDTSDELNAVKLELLNLKTDYKSLETQLNFVKQDMEKKDNSSETGLDLMMSELMCLKSDFEILESNMTQLKDDVIDLKGSEANITSLIHKVHNMSSTVDSTINRVQVIESEVGLINATLPDVCGLSAENSSENVSACSSRPKGNIAFEVVQRGSTGRLNEGESVKFNDVKYDSGSNFNNHTGIFSVPVSGTYLFWISAIIQNPEKESGGNIRVYTKNDLLGFGFGYSQISFTVVGFVQAGDQVWFSSANRVIFRGYSSYGGVLLHR